ncbi:MAG: DUF5693 family protein [Armatimonadia bacterium]
MTTAQRAAIAALIIVGLLGAIWAATGRVATERSNRTVALCLDDLELRELAALTGQTPQAVLSRFKSAGATHVAVSEQTLGQFLQTGQLQLRQDPQSHDTVLTGDYNLLTQFRQPLASISGAKLVGPASIQMINGRPNPSGPYPFAGLHVPSAVPTMVNLGLGYDDTVVSAIKQAGLFVIARPMPDLLLTPPAIENSMLRARALGSIVLFNGVSVSGGAKLAKRTAAIMQRHGLQFGFVELVPQEGAANLASALKYQVIRTHSISQEEMTKTSPSRGLDRFVLGVTERNIRLCYIRLLLSPQPDIVKANLAYVKSIHDALSRTGYTFGDPQPFQPVHLPTGALLLLTLGVVGGGLWLLHVIFDLPNRWFWGLMVLGIIVCLGGTVAAPGLIRALFPLLAAIIFPTLAILQVSAQADRGAPSTHPVACASALVIVAALLTAVGGLLIAGLLSSSDYMMQIAQFRGVKFAQLLPLLIIFIVTLARTYAPNTRSAGVSPASDQLPTDNSKLTTDPGWPTIRAGLITATDAFVRYWHAIAIFVALGAVAFMIMRSGNESAVEVSSFELRLRALLDQILVVRPRTKEILFGYPALFLGLSLLLNARRRGAWILLTFGSIALISLTNTFCHLHTPLFVSLLRAVNGLWVGLLVGILWFVAKLIVERILQAVWWNNQT